MWVDTFVAVPTLGLQTTPSFTLLSKGMDRLEPMLDDAIARDKNIEVGIAQTGWGLTFKTKQGFTYKLLLDNIIVEFAYAPEEKRLAGRLPAQEQPEIEVYSVLADRTVGEMARMLGLLAQATPKIIRVGLLANVLMEKSKAPPGIGDMIKRHAEVFSGELVKSEATFLSNIERTSTYTDRCHHTYIFDDVDKPDDLTVKLDWQRVFTDPLQLPPSTASGPWLHQMKGAAMAYFERVGQGTAEADQDDA